jgi:hypothetical protein
MPFHELIALQVGDRWQMTARGQCGMLAALGDPGESFDDVLDHVVALYTKQLDEMAA